MDIPQIRKRKPAPKQFLKRFDPCFPGKDTRAHLPVYVSGQLSDIPEKSVEPIAINAGVPPRTLQEFLSQHHWEHDLLRDELQRMVRDEHAGPHSVAIFDKTSDVKQGDKTPGVQRQWCGSVGKKENCLVTVHLAYARDGFHCLLDGELYLPKSWSDDRERCREAGIPDDMVYRPKWKIALGLYDHAVANGVHFTGSPSTRGTAANPSCCGGCRAGARSAFWRGAEELHGPGQGASGRHPAVPQARPRPWPQDARLASGSPPSQRVDAMLDRDGLRNPPWIKWRVKGGQKGPMVWDVEPLRLSPRGRGTPAG